MSSLKTRLEQKLAQNTARHVAAQQEAEFDEGRHHTKIHLELIDPNPYQPRRHFSESEIEVLAASIDKEGLLQPISVRPLGHRFQLIAGERRWKACKLLGYNSIEAIIIPTDDAKMAVWALIENIQREELSDYEIGQALRQLENEFPSKAKLAEEMGINREDMYRYFSFEVLPVHLQTKLVQQPKLLSRSAMVDIKRVLQQHEKHPKTLHFLNVAWNMLEAGELDQGKVASFIVRNLTTPNEGRSLDVRRDAVKLSRDGKQVGSLSKDENGVVLRLKATSFTDAQIQSLEKFVENLIAEKV